MQVLQRNQNFLTCVSQRGIPVPHGECGLIQGPLKYDELIVKTKYNIKFRKPNLIQELLGITNRLQSLIRHGPPRKRDLQQLFSAAGTCLTSCYLVMTGGYTNPKTLILQDMDRIENDTSNNSSIVACIPYGGNVFIEPLPSNESRIYSTEALSSNDRGVHLQTHRLMGGIF
jgi:hypothetical protein